MANSVYTITFSECVENHVGMQKVGQISSNGFTIEELEKAMDKLKEDGVECTLVDLTLYEYDTERAAILIIYNGMNVLGSPADKLLEEQDNITYDATYYDTRRKSVLNKRARHNVCFGEEEQEPDMEEGKGTIIAFNNVPLLNNVRKRLSYYLGDKASQLMAEGNKYYDPNKCGIGYHGDVERRKVIALRLGGTMDLWYSWFYSSKSIGDPYRIILDHGDMYVMSEKATGNDWKKRSIFTLRHAAGCKKYTSLAKYI